MPSSPDHKRDTLTEHTISSHAHTYTTMCAVVFYVNGSTRDDSAVSHGLWTRGKHVLRSLTWARIQRACATVVAHAVDCGTHYAMRVKESVRRQCNRVYGAWQQWVDSETHPVIRTTRQVVGARYIPAFIASRLPASVRPWQQLTARECVRRAWASISRAGARLAPYITVVGKIVGLVQMVFRVITWCAS